MRPIRPIAFLLALAFALATVFAAQARSLYDLAPITTEVQRQVQLYSLPGATLRLDTPGSVVYQQDFGSYTPSTRIPIASASKWLSALVIARLVEKHEMEWQDPVGAYFPDAPPATRAITLRQLFSHTSGLPGNGDAPCLSQRTVTLDTCARQILQMPMIAAPGQVFAYGGNSMQVAGRMAEIASGRSWDQLFVDEMVVPLGLTGTDYATASLQPGYVSTNNPRIAGGVRSTVADYARVLDMLLAGGLAPSGRFLDSTTLDYMALDHSAGTVIAYTPYPESLGYGIGQWREAEDARGVAYRVSSPGAYGTYPFVDRQQGVSGVYLVLGDLGKMKSDEIALIQLCLRQLDFVRGTLPPPQMSPATQITAPTPVKSTTGAAPAAKTTRDTTRPAPRKIYFLDGSRGDH